jgi:methylenetetrahydrofolate reductase (NADPH)
MPSLTEFYAASQFGLSFELFPPKTPEGDAALVRHVDQLMKFGPSFITCTYGAGGSTRDKTLEIVERIRGRYQVPVASHLTCVGSTSDQLRAYLSEARRRKIDHIVALRGDPPQGTTEFRPALGGLRYASELVELIRAEFPDFGIAVAGYPETHREAPSPEMDLHYLKRKVDAGADIVITQLFYRNDDFFRFRDRCAAAGIRVPLVPGILPVTNLAQIQRITSLCGAVLPPDFVETLGQRDDEQWQFEVGVDFAARQVRQLVDAGVPGLHFYVLNKSQATSSVLRAVGLRVEG